MKTAISLPDDLFAEVERLVATRGVTRSQLYQEALREYVQRHDPERITAAWDDLVAREGDATYGFGEAAAARALAEVEW